MKKDMQAVQSIAKPPVKHEHRRTSWFLANGYIEWCYQCGAFRSLTQDLEPHGKWQKPSGLGGENPAMKDKK